MAQFPMLPLYTDAFMADTAHLSTVEVGAYLLLLMAAWRTRECALPNDERKLQRITKMNNPTWGRSKKTLLAFWQIGDDGLLFQKRLKGERSKAILYSHSQSERSRQRKLFKDNDTDRSHDHPAQGSAGEDPGMILPSPSPSSTADRSVFNDQAQRPERATRARASPSEKLNGGVHERRHRRRWDGEGELEPDPPMARQTGDTDSDG